MADTAIQHADLLLPKAALPHTPKPGASVTAPRESVLPDRPQAGTDARETGRTDTRAQSADDTPKRAKSDGPDQAGRNRSKTDQDDKQCRTRREQIPFAAVLKLLTEGEPVRLTDEVPPEAEAADQQQPPAEPEPAQTFGKPVQVAGVRTAPVQAGGVKAAGDNAEAPAAGQDAETFMPQAAQPASKAEVLVEADGGEANVEADGKVAGLKSESADAPQVSGKAAESAGTEQPDARPVRLHVTSESRPVQQSSQTGSTDEARNTPQQTVAAGENSSETGETARMTNVADGEADDAQARTTEQARTASASETPEQNGDARQQRQNAPRASVSGGGEPQPTTEHAGQSSAEGGEGDGRGSAGEAGERFQAALRQAAGNDAPATVTTRTEQTHAPNEQQAATQIDAEAASAADAGRPAAQQSAAPAGARTPAAQVADSVAETVQAGAARSGRQITVRLNPPELGSVRITFESDGEQLRGVLEVANPRTLSEIQRELPALMNRLSDSGVQLRRMDLNLTDHDSGNSHLPDFADSETGPGGRGGSDAAPARGETDDETSPEPVATASAPNTRIEDDAINVWI